MLDFALSLYLKLREDKITIVYIISSKLHIEINYFVYQISLKSTINVYSHKWAWAYRRYLQTKKELKHSRIKEIISL